MSLATAISQEMLTEIVTPAGSRRKKYTLAKRLPCITTKGATTCEKPIRLLLLLSCFGIIHGVHITDKSYIGDLSSINILGGHDNKLSTIEHHRAVWNT